MANSFIPISKPFIMPALKARGTDTRPYFCTMSSLPMYRRSPLPVSAAKATIGLNLPSFLELTKDDVRVGAAVNQVLEQGALDDWHDGPQH